MQENKKIKVSIITPNYNGEKYLEETINSVITQSCKKFEYIILDGNSTDSSKDILERNRSKIDKIIISDDKGPYDAIDKGIRIAKGEIIIWINSDDILHKDAVRNVIMIFNSDKKLKWISGINSYIKNNIAFSFIPYIYPNLIIRKGFAHHNYWGFIQQESVSFKKKLYLQSGGFKTKFGNAGDYHLWKVFSNLSSLKSFNIKIGYFRSWYGQNSVIQKDKYYSDTGIRKNFISLRLVRIIISIIFFPYLYFLTRNKLRKNKSQK